MHTVIEEGRDLRVLLVEDEFLVALDAEDMLHAIGFENIAMASTFKQAMRAIEEDSPDIVFLDMNLNGERSEPIAAFLAESGVSFVITSGYYLGPEDLETFKSPPYLRKPYTQSDLYTAARAALSVVPSMHDAQRQNTIS